MPSFQVPVLGSLFVSFRPSLIRFPQLFLRCFPCAFAFGLFRFPSGSFRPLPFRLFPCFPSDFGTQLSCNSFLRLLFRITGATSAAGLLFPARPFPLAFALGSGYLAG